MSNTLHNASWRKSISIWLTRPTVEYGLTALIIINAIILGLETYPVIMQRFGELLQGLDTFILWVFVLEIGLRIAASGWRFFRDPWGLFDFTVVAIALVPASGAFAVLRALRILRVLRLLTLVPSMRAVVGGLLGALPGLGSVIAVMALIFYVSSVMATKLFGDAFPSWFGTLGESGYTLFQVMTLESWSMGIARPVIEVFPYAWVFFVIFILIATFTMLNLFIGVVVNAIQAEHDEEKHDAQRAAAMHLDNQHALTRQEIDKLRLDMANIRELLEQSGHAR